MAKEDLLDGHFNQYALRNDIILQIRKRVFIFYKMLFLKTYVQFIFFIIIVYVRHYPDKLPTE